MVSCSPTWSQVMWSSSFSRKNTRFLHATATTCTWPKPLASQRHSAASSLSSDIWMAVTLWWPTLLAKLFIQVSLYPKLFTFFLSHCASLRLFCQSLFLSLTWSSVCMCLEQSLWTRFYAFYLSIFVCLNHLNAHMHTNRHSHAKGLISFGGESFYADC